MELDARIILTISGMAASIIAAAVLVKTKLSVTIEQLKDVEKRLRVLDQRVDKSELTAQRVDTLQKMLAPEKREKLHRSLAAMEQRIVSSESEISHLRGMHNHKHPSVKEE
jgi:hypothetical protein